MYLKTVLKFLTSLLQVSCQFYALSLLFDCTLEAREYVLLSQYRMW